MLLPYCTKNLVCLTLNWVLKSLLTGIKRVKGNLVQQKLPITLDILLRIHSTINFNSSFDASFWAACLLLSLFFFRKSNLLPLSDKHYDPHKQFSRSSFRFFHWGVLVSVSWSKTIQFMERSTHIPFPHIPGSPFCPVASLLHAMSFTRSSAPSIHAFTYFDPSHRAIRCLMYRSFVTKLRDCLSRLGYPPLSYASHLFRRGGASFAFQSGTPVELIKMLGDWKSDLVLLDITVPLSIRLHSANVMSEKILKHCV